MENRGEEEHPLRKIAEAVAAKLMNVGERIKDTAANVLLSLGYQIHALLYVQAAFFKSIDVIRMSLLCHIHICSVGAPQVALNPIHWHLDDNADCSLQWNDMVFLCNVGAALLRRQQWRHRTGTPAQTGCPGCS